MAVIPKTSYLNFADLFNFQGETFFDTPDFPAIPISDKDKYVTIDSSYLGRIDLIAHDFYRDSSLWWVIALANNLDSLPTQVKLGIRLRVPALVTVRSILSKGKKK